MNLENANIGSRSNIPDKIERLPAFVTLIISQSINAIMSLLGFLVLINKKFELHQLDFFLYVRFMFVNDMFSFVYTLIYETWHVRNAIIRVPEVMTIKVCFYRIVPQVFLISNNQIIHLLIAFDRYTSVKSPLKYVLRIRSFYLNRIVGCLILSLTFFLVSFFDKFDNTALLTYCSSRVGLGNYASLILWSISFVVSTATVSIYVVILVTARLKTKKTVAPTGLQKNDVQAHRNRLMMKITKVSIASGVCYFIVGPFNVAASAALKVYAPKLSVFIGQYMSVLFYCGSSIYFVNLMIFVDDFRSSVKCLFK